MTTGEKIAALRREKGMSQEALGGQLGLSRQAVSKWEADQTMPTMDNLVELGRLFGVPVDTLLRPDEPLPDKAQPPEGVKLSAEGLKVSYAPVLTRKTKWFIIMLAVLMWASVLGNLYAMARVQSLEGQLRALQVQVQQQQAAQQNVEQDALEDYDIAYQPQYGAQGVNAETLALSLSARPRGMRSANDIAKFTIQSAGETWTCAAILQQDNSYVSSTEIPLRDGFTAYLTLTDRENGGVRHLLLETVSGLADAAGRR